MNEQFLRLLNISEQKDKKVITVALVSEMNDSYRTIINPKGCITPLESVPVDYNHNRISTGAKMFDGGIRKLSIPNPDDPTSKMEVEARIVNVEVYKGNRMWTKDNKDKRADDVPDLYEMVENGRVSWGSVDFFPVIDSVEEVYRASSGELIRKEIKKWGLNYFSLLDKKPGQDTSYFLDVRSAPENNLIVKKQTMQEIIAQLRAKLIAQNLLTEDDTEASISNLRQEFTDEKNGSYSFTLTKGQETKNYSIGYTSEETEVRMAEAEEIQEKAEEKPEEKEEAPKKETELTEDEQRAAEVVANNKRMMEVGTAVKNKAGELGVITTTEEKEDVNGSEVCIATITKMDGTTITVNGDQIGYSWQESTEVPREWTEASTGDILLALSQSNQTVRALSEVSTKLKEDFEIANKTYQRVLNSPKDGEQSKDLEGDTDLDDKGQRDNDPAKKKESSFDIMERGKLQH